MRRSPWSHRPPEDAQPDYLSASSDGPIEPHGPNGWIGGLERRAVPKSQPQSVGLGIGRRGTGDREGSEEQRESDTPPGSSETRDRRAHDRPARSGPRRAGTANKAGAPTRVDPWMIGSHIPIRIGAVARQLRRNRLGPGPRGGRGTAGAPVSVPAIASANASVAVALPPSLVAPSDDTYGRLLRWTERPQQTNGNHCRKPAHISPQYERAANS